MNMKRLLTYAAIAVMFLLILTPIAGAMAGNAEDVKQGQGNKDGKDGQERAQNMRRAAEKNCFGQFTEDNGTIDGRFVQFDYNETTGVITDYKIYSGSSYLKIFDMIQVENLSNIETHLSGAVFWLNGSNAKIILHNNPTAVMQVVNPYGDEPFTVIYDVADSIEITEDQESNARRYTLTMNDFEVYINTPNDSSMIDDEIKVHSNGTGHSLFMTIPGYGNQSKEHQRKVADGAMNGKIGGEMEIVGSGENAVSHKVAYRQNLNMQVKSMEKNRMRLRVESQEHNGTRMMVRFEKEALNLEQNKVQVKLDGEKMEKATFEKVMEGGEKAKYSVQEGENGIVEVCMNVPSFSEHEITIQKAEKETPGFITPVLLTTSAIAVGIYAVKKRK